LLFQPIVLRPIVYLAETGSVDPRELGRPPAAKEDTVQRNEVRCISLLATAARAVAVLAALAGCTSVVPMRDMVENPERFLRSNFSPEKLSPEVRAAVERGERVQPRFDRVAVKYAIQSDEDGVSKLSEAMGLYVNAGNGYVLRRSEYSRNGIPYRINNALLVAGAFPLRWQAGFHGNERSSEAFQYREVNRLDRGIVSPKPGEVYVIEGSTSQANQVTSHPARVECKASDGGSATAYSPNLSGPVVDLECSHLAANGSVMARDRLIFLSDYGLALHMGGSSARAKSSHTITGVEVTR
jgi:hypothetical protein